MALPVVGPGFTQQGTIDWVSLVSKPLNFSVGVVARLSASNVDAYTIVIGQAMARNFQLGPSGRHKVQHALSTLKSYGGYGNAVWFGFGVQSLVRTLGQTSEGSALLALCAAMGECFQEDLAAEVLYSMARSYKAPESLTPSVSEWLALVKCCSGILSTTEFPMLTEGLMSMIPSEHRFTTGGIDGFPALEKLAAAIMALCKVSRKESTDICIRGGRVCGWLGAVATWLLDLTITISNGQTLLYSNTPDGDKPQVQFFCDNNSPEQLNNELEIASET